MNKILITLIFFNLLSCKGDNKKILTIHPKSKVPNFIFVLVDEFEDNSEGLFAVRELLIFKSGVEAIFGEGEEFIILGAE